MNVCGCVCAVGSLFHFWQKWHISHPTEQGECCFCQFFDMSNCGRKWFPVLACEHTCISCYPRAREHRHALACSHNRMHTHSLVELHTDHTPPSPRNCPSCQTEALGGQDIDQLWYVPPTNPVIHTHMPTHTHTPYTHTHTPTQLLVSNSTPRICSEASKDQRFATITLAATCCGWRASWGRSRAFLPSTPPVSF